MSKDKEKNKYKSSTVWIMFLFGIWIGLGMGGTLVALICANSLQDVDVSLGKAIELQKENNQLAIDLEVLKYQYNNTLQYKLEKEKAQKYKLIMNNCYKNANNFDERFEKMLDSYILAREEKTQSDYHLALCTQGINPYNYSN